MKKEKFLKLILLGNSFIILAMAILGIVEINAYYDEM
jgi:hypothetical protein